MTRPPQVVTATVPADVPAWYRIGGGDLPVGRERRFHPSMLGCCPTILYQPQVLIVPLRVYPADHLLPLTFKRFRPHYQQASPTVIPAVLPRPPIPFQSRDPVPALFRRFVTADQQTHAAPSRASLAMPFQAYPAAWPNPLTFTRFVTADQQAYTAPSKATITAPSAAVLPTGELPTPIVRRFAAYQQSAMAGKPISTVIPPVMPLIQLPFIPSRKPELQGVSGVFQIVMAAPPLSWSPPVFQPFAPRPQRWPHEQSSAPTRTYAPPIPHTTQIPPSSPVRRTIGLSSNIIVTVNEKTNVAALLQLPVMWGKRSSASDHGYAVLMPATAPISGGGGHGTGGGATPVEFVCVDTLIGYDFTIDSLTGIDGMTTSLSGVDGTVTNLTGSC